MDEQQGADISRATQPYYCRSVEARDCWFDTQRIARLTLVTVMLRWNIFFSIRPS